uniref:Uncharacterized protein n=1 Tax=Glossina palpalis gambiensis TaxID=67801 RepID=A0A1B0AMQ1_9MUSC
MPDRKKFIAFDRQRVREQIGRFTFKEALLVKGPIYESVLNELYLEGYIFMAQRFQHLINVEKRLIARLYMKNKVQEVPDLFWGLIEKCREAEKSYKFEEFGGKKVCFALLHQSLLLIDRHCPKYQWLYGEMIAIVMAIIKDEHKNVVELQEILARIFYRCGRHYSEVQQKYEDACNVLRDVCDLSLGQGWRPELKEVDGYRFDSLHDAASRKLAQIYLLRGRTLASTDMKLALKLAHKAILAIVEGKFRRNLLLLYNAYIEKHEYMIELQHYQMALKDMKKMYQSLMVEGKIEFMLVKCKVLKNTGVCLYALNDVRNALLKLRQAYAIARKYHYEFLEGTILQEIGKVYTSQKGRQVEAREVLTSARGIFLGLDDDVNRRKIDYLLANLNAINITPLLLKKCTSDDFCDLFYLRRWKTRCEPYWDAFYQEIEFHAEDAVSSVSTDLSRKSENDNGIMEDVEYKKGGMKYSVYLSDAARGEKTLTKRPLCLLWEKEYDQRNMLWNAFNFRFSVFEN